MLSLPRLGEKKHRLDVIGGAVPNPLHFPGGCKFHPDVPSVKTIRIAISRNRL
jgi:ABC-type dipeptide/oligopeptide/nickel transport system ATPase component